MELNHHIHPAKIIAQRAVNNITVKKSLYHAGSRSVAHFHSNPRFVLVLRGTFEEKYGCLNRDCLAHTMIFRPSGEIHSENYSSGPVVCMSIDLGSGWNQQSLIPVHSPFHVRSPMFGAIAARIDHELTINDDLSDFALEALLMELMVEASRRMREPEKSIPLWLKHVTNLLENEFLRNWSLADLAAYVDIHPVYLSRVFRRVHGCTMAEFQRRVRILHAAKIIAETDQPLSQIAVSSGFHDQSHFTRIFKDLLGTTPAVYRFRMRSS